MNVAVTTAPASPRSVSPVSWRHYFRPTTFPFWGVHLAALLGVFYVGFSWKGVAVATVAYFTRMFIVTAAYHRYFSHRAFKTSRWFQFVLAFLAQTSAQKGVLWWASHHRWHHKQSDTDLDVHSAKLKGFWYSHVGWILGPEWNATDYRRVADLAKFPELRVLNTNSVRLLPAVLLGIVCYVVGGSFGLVWAFLVSTVLLWHGSFSINSLSHMFGRRVYATTDDSRNNWLLAILTTGEGWHNNHHHFMSSANQGFRWYEIDVTFYLLRLLSAVGLIWDLRRPPAEVIAGVVAPTESAATSPEVAPAAPVTAV